MANFEQVIKWLREGKKVRRPIWKPRTFWALGKDECVVCNHNNSDFLEIPHIHVEQLKAADWEIYEDKEKFPIKHTYNTLTFIIHEAGLTLKEYGAEIFIGKPDGGRFKILEEFIKKSKEQNA